MRAVASEIDTIMKSRAKPRHGSRFARLRKSRLRSMALESLESRTLLATVPAATVTNTLDISNTGGNQSSPSIAIDPVNQNDLVAVWTRLDPNLTFPNTRVGGAFSTNAGVTWTAFTPYSIANDPTKTAAPFAFDQTTSASVDFDRNGNFYVVVSQHSSDNNTGEILLNKFSTGGGTVTNVINNAVVYSWISSTTPVDRALKPTLVVDNNVPSFTDGSTTQTDPGAGDVYIAWASNDDAPSGATNWNPNAIRMTASTNGGSSFLPIATINAGGNFGTQRNTAPRMTVSQGSAGVAGGQVTIAWDDFGTLSTATPTPLDRIMVDQVPAPTGGTLVPGPNILVTTTTVRGAQDLTYPTASAASPLGIGPGVVIASDNTLGAFSPYEGRLYLAYVDRSTATTPVPNPADNTDVFLRTSDDGGTNWSAPVMVNDDNALTDGFSEAHTPTTTNAVTSGRAQFEPSIAVDQSTGTVVVTFYDGRYDAARARVSTTIAVSIDGGKTFGPETFANNPLQVTDEATGQVTTLGPIPDNESAGNTAPGADRATFAFGDRQGLAVSHGHIYPAWSSNLNGGTDGKQLLNIRVASAETAAGPRIISATMGPVGLPGDTLNNATAADGTPIAKSFIVTFDRPVDPASFTLSQAQVFFHDTVAGDAPVAVPVLAVAALNLNAFGATSFRVDFTPSSQVGTYSFAVGPTIQDRIRSVSSTTTATTLGQNTYNAVAPQVPKTIVDGPSVPNRVTSTIPVANIPVGRLVTGVTLNLTLMYPFTGDLTLTLIAPNGTQVQLVSQQPAFAAGNGDPTSGFINTTFDDAAATSIDAAGGAPYTGTFKPEGQLSNLIGANGNGTWTLQIDDNFPVFDSTGSLQNWSLTIKYGTVTVNTTTTTGNMMDQNANGTTGETNADVFAVPTPIGSTPFQAPYNQNTLPLIVPGPHVASTSVPGGVSDPNAPGTPNTLMLNGTVSSLVVTFDRDMDPSTFTPSKVLRIEGPAGLINGPFTVTPVAGTARSFTIGFPTQELSGTYTITLDSSIKSASGFALDTNLNAGIDVLRGTSSNAPASLTFNSAAVPVTIQPMRTVSSTIQLNNDFVIQGLTLSLNITYPFDPDLSAVLVAPDGTTIPLFTNVGTTGNNQNFTSTVFDDNATTPITNGGPPFFGRFKPEQPLGVLNNSSSIKGPGGTGTGLYTLEITNASTGTTGTLNSWSLTMLKPTPTSGLGEPVADRAQLSFRIFTMDPANPVSSNTWTSVGPASIGGTRSGRVGGIAVDPSDPSGNTVYVAGASGGIWKTNNFLTTSSNGPTYIPLTDFGPTFGVNIGGIAVFGRNNDPNQSIIFVATGEGDSGSTGVGFLRSMDGGATWTLLDSTDNTLPYASRDHAFVGSTSFKIVVDPRPTPTGDVIVYAALSGTNGGLWRSTDSGMHWGVVDPTTGKRVANLAGQATDVVLDPDSGPVDAVSNPTGNLQVVYAAFRGDGVYSSPNQGQVWNKLLGGVGDPFIQDGGVNPHVPIPVNNLAVSPNGANGRIVLAKPDLFPSSDPNAALKNFIYEGWLYAAVVTPDDHLQGLYLTKDSGQNWTKLTLPTLGAVLGHPSGIPSNDTNLGNYDVLGNTTFAQGNYDVSLVSDPTNPEVVYLGGTADGNPSGLIRIDVTAMSDPYSFFLANDRSDGGTLSVNSTTGAALKQNPLPPVTGYDPRSNPTINMTRNPANPLGNSTFYVNNTASFANNGSGVKWIPFDTVLDGSTDQHRVIAIRDPLTGKARLIFGDDQGIFSGVDNGDGTLSAGIGSDVSPTGSRNGNLQITQFYYGASQPSTSAATQIAHALFYGSAQDDGAPHSTGDILSTGNLSWSGPGGDYGGVATDQTGTGDLYQYAWPCCGGNITDFFQVNGVGHTNGLVQASGNGNVPDPQWPFLGVLNFAVNPINGKQIVIDSSAGRVFRTEDEANWRVLGDPTVFGGSNALALAFGAPDPALTGGSLDNFIYVGTQAGHIFMTFTGGGATGNNWFDITNGDLAGNTAPVQAIITNPTRTSHEAFAVTTNGVYYITDSNPASGATWKRITGNLFQITHNPFGDPSLQETQLKYLTSIQADWRYVLPNDPSVPGGPTHPVLYVAGEGGVYQSIDLGQTWSLFPNTLPNSLVTLPTPPGAGGGLPDAHVTDLDLSTGNVDPTTGRAVLQPGDPNVLLASTYGRGSFAIRLAPLVHPNTFTTPVQGGAQNWLTMTPAIGYTTTNYPVTNVGNPTINGYSEQSAFGNTINVALYNLTAAGSVVGPSTAIPLTGTLTTNANGQFSLHIAPGYFTTSGYYTIGVQATDESGSVGNVALLKILVELPPVPAPTKVVLDPASDSGTFNNDDYTFDNNSVQHPAPVFDISGILPGATVELVRNGVVVGMAVNPATAPGLYTVQVADTNGGNGVIPDSPVGNPIDTPPPAGNPYNYTAFQIDTFSFASGPSSPPLQVIIDSTAPAPPTKLVLDPVSDSGTKNNDDYTWDNNSAQHPAPVFDVSGIEPNATVVLLRNGVIVNEMIDTTGGTVQIADTNGAYNGMPGNGPIPDSPVGNPPDTAPPAGNPYSYTSYQIDLAGNGGPPPSSPLQVIIDSTPPLAPPIILDPASDTGTFNNDGVTQDNNGNPYPAPVFDLTGIEPNAIVQLYRTPVVNGVPGTPVLVNTQTQGATAAIGSFSIADTNGGNGVIPDGTYLYTAKQTDLAGNVGPLDTPITVIIDATPPVAPTQFRLDPASDTGTFNNDDVTRDNNSALYGPPVFDASAIEAHANLELFRAPVVNGVVGTSVLVNTLVNVPAGGTLMIPDINAGNGVIPDGTYQYSAKQVDLAGNISTLSNVVTVVINTALPTPNPAPVPILDPASDTGTFNNDDITQDNNGNPYPAPVLDVGTVAKPIAATETVELFRAPVVNGVVGAPVLVNTLTNVKAGVIQIPDINAGNGRIADGTYLYTDQLITLAGVPGMMSGGLKVIIDATPPVAPSPFRLDAGSDTGVSNSDGITQITLKQFPVFDVGNIVAGATVNLYRNGVIVSTLTNTAGGTVQILDHNQIPDGSYTYTVGQVDLAGNISLLGGPITVIYDTAQPPTPPTPVLDPNSDTGIKGDNITSDTSPFFDVTVALSGFEANSSLSLVRDGTVIAFTPYNVTSGTVMIQDLGPVSYGVHTYQVFLTDLAGNKSALGGPVKITFAANAAGTLVLDPASDSGVKGDSITNVTSPTFDAASLPANEMLRLLRNGVVVSSVLTGGGGALTITDPGPLSSGKYTYTAVLVTSAGVASPPGPPLVITIDTTTPPPPTGLKLDPASDTGTKGDNITSVTSPTIDVSSILPGATVELFRNGSVVATATSPAGGTVMVTDPGPLFRGMYTYTAMQVSVAGNTSKTSTSLTITIDTSVPPAPTVALDPGSDTGIKGDNTTSVTNPFMDASGIVAGATVTLFRNGVSVATLTNAAAGTVKIQDPGPLGLGAYTYAAQQTSVAGVASPVGSPVTITIVAPAATPSVPTLQLASASDTGIKGDGITAAHKLTFTGVADAGVTVNIYSSGTLVGTGTATPGGTYSITMTTTVLNGVYAFQAQAVNSSNVSSAMSTPALQVKIVTIDGDYSDAGKASVAVFRRVKPNIATWFVQGIAGLTNYNFGAGSLDVPMTADFNADGKNDPTLYRPSTGQWFTAPSGSSTYTGQLLVTFGGPNDIPVPADYSGNGASLESVFRPSTGNWYFYNGGAGKNITSPVVFPVNSDPVPGDYEGVGKAEIAVYNPATSQWLVASPGATLAHVVASFGGSADIPVPGQYDNIALAAAGKAQVTEAAVWRPSTGQYFIKGPSGTRIVKFAVGDIPVPGDWDGIGQTEPAVYRPSTSQWLVEGPTDTSPRVIATYGGPNDIPLLSPYPYRAIPSGINGFSVRGGSSGSGSGSTLSGGASAFDFGGSSLGMTKGSSLGEIGSSGTSSSILTNAGSPPPAASPFSVIATTRPKQAQPQHKPQEHSKMEQHLKAKASVIDKALHSLAGLTKRKGHGSKRV